MSRLTPNQLLVANLRGTLLKSYRGYIPRRGIVRVLRANVEADLGDDLEAWAVRVAKHGLTPELFYAIWQSRTEGKATADTSGEESD